MANPWDEDHKRFPLGHTEYWESHGFKCSATLQPNLGTWTGYVHLPEQHPDYPRGDDRDRLARWDKLAELEVHGGVTYANEGKIGFDCAHGDDIIPVTVETMRAHFGHAAAGQRPGATYKNFEFVKGEIAVLAQQLQDRAHSRMEMDG
jgi:hypothetical protein